MELLTQRDSVILGPCAGKVKVDASVPSELKPPYITVNILPITKQRMDDFEARIINATMQRKTKIISPARP